MGYSYFSLDYGARFWICAAKVLITQECFHYYGAALEQHGSISAPPISEKAGGSQGAGR